VPTALEELVQMGRSLWRRRTDILAFFDHHASNGPTEAINGRLEALPRNALGFRNLTNYRWRSLLRSGVLHALVNAPRITKSRIAQVNAQMLSAAGLRRCGGTICAASADHRAVPNGHTSAYELAVRLRRA